MIKKIFLLIFLLSSINLWIEAQTIIDTSNDEEIFVLGRRFKVHTVKSGETIYSLSKVYHVPSEQILLINNEVVTNLKAGDVLRIPVIDSNYTPYPLTKVTFIEHKVQRKESLFGIAQQYGVTQDEIIKYNPQIQNGIKKGMVLKIPVEEKTKLQGEDELFIYHQVRRGENLQTIASLYGVNVDVLKKINNIEDVKEGNIVAIPKKELSEDQIYLLKNNAKKTPDLFDIDPNYFEDPNYPPCNKFVYNDSMTFKIAIILPLYLDLNYSKSIEALKSPENLEYFRNSRIFYSFLQGIFLAADDLKRENVNLDIHIYDSQNDSSTISGILKKPFVRSCDLVIGPVYSKYYNQIRQFCEQTRINVVSPLSRKTPLQENPFVFQPSPSYETITKFIAKFIAKNADTSTIAVVVNGSGYYEQLADILKKNILEYSSADSLDFRLIQYSKFITPYQNSLDTGKNIIVFVPNTDEIEVSAIMNNLNALVTVNNYHISVYAMPVIHFYSKIQSDWFANLNVHYPTVLLDNVDKSDFINFNILYEGKFGRKPDRFVYIGYDEMYYFVNQLRTHGKYFQFCMYQNAEISTTGRFMNFDFRRVGLKDGFENRAMIMYYFTKNLELKTIEDPIDYQEFYYKNSQ